MNIGIAFLVVGGLLIGVGLARFLFIRFHGSRKGEPVEVNCTQCNEFTMLPVNSHSRRRRMGLCKECFNLFLIGEQGRRAGKEITDDNEGEVSRK